MGHGKNGTQNGVNWQLLDCRSEILAGCGKSLNRDDSPPQGLKPSLILHDLRGAKAPLYHSAAGFRDFFRSACIAVSILIACGTLRLRSGQASEAVPFPIGLGVRATRPSRFEVRPSAAMR